MIKVGDVLRSPWGVGIVLCRGILSGELYILWRGGSETRLENFFEDEPYASRCWVIGHCAGAEEIEGAFDKYGRA